MDKLWKNVIILYEPLIELLKHRFVKQLLQNHWSTVPKKNETGYLGCGIYLCVWTSVGDPDPYVLNLPDPHQDPLVTSMDPAPEAAPDPAPDPSIIKQKW